MTLDRHPDASLDRQGMAFAKVSKAYGLGKARIADVLAAKRSDDEARPLARVAAIDTAQAQFRMALDLHRLSGHR